jgi:protein tyrosine/serine phosphatase
MNLKTILKRSGYLLAAAGLSFGAYVGALQLTGNFHEVLANQLYRSNQPSPGEIETYAKRYGIKSIINLRGKSDSASWYDNEVASATELGIKHVDFRMSASKQLTPSEIEQLADIMRGMPKPILIHCRSGSDRTGLASVIYLNQVAGIDEETAEGQLSLWFGHVGIPYISAAYAMDASWEKFERSLRHAKAKTQI